MRFAPANVRNYQENDKTEFPQEPFWCSHCNLDNQSVYLAGKWNTTWGPEQY